DTALSAKFHANVGGISQESQQLEAQIRALGTMRGIGPLLDLTAQVAALKEAAS
ncbi:MAG: hypothetical protein HOV68_15100, partial [Streptomycetaceae bacterium]|nr:hypothetical protein [Streptomycetaceae bacterium]